MKATDADALNPATTGREETTMTMMQQALAESRAAVQVNLMLGLDDDSAKEQAVALFRLARMVAPEPTPEPTVCWRQAVRRMK